MEYVMVPVPEEYAAEVAQYLQWNVGSVSLEYWADEGAEQFLDSLDEQTRAIVMHAAEAAADVHVLPVSDVARFANCSEREIVGLVVEVNEIARKLGGPPFMLATALIHETTESGPQAWTLNMPGAVAEVLLELTGGSRRREDEYNRIAE